jgi:hypothetical protein
MFTVLSLRDGRYRLFAVTLLSVNLGKQTKIALTAQNEVTETSRALY